MNDGWLAWIRTNNKYPFIHTCVCAEIAYTMLTFSVQAVLCIGALGACYHSVWSGTGLCRHGVGNAASGFQTPPLDKAP